MRGREALVLVPLCLGCATAPTLRADDPVFAAGQARLRESAERAVGTKALAPDEVLFLQAESFFRYRFELRRGRRAESYLEQALAAFTDFAPLTVLATSQGLFDVRLRAYDGAAQLYRSLVEDHPSSRLRPLALYRLGWACRSTSRDGFPCSSDEAFEAVARDYPDLPLAALSRAASHVPHKSLDRATLWSILPGAGQLYVGETLNGTIRLTIGAGFGALALLPIVGMVRARKFEWLPTALSVVGVVGLEVTYTTAYQDAQRAVVDFNEAHEAAFEAAHP